MEQDFSFDYHFCFTMIWIFNIRWCFALLHFRFSYFRFRRFPLWSLWVIIIIITTIIRWIVLIILTFIIIMIFRRLWTSLKRKDRLDFEEEGGSIYLMAVDQNSVALNIFLSRLNIVEFRVYYFEWNFYLNLNLFYYSIPTWRSFEDVNRNWLDL